MASRKVLVKTRRSRHRFGELPNLSRGIRESDCEALPPFLRRPNGITSGSDANGVHAQVMEETLQDAYEDDPGRDSGLSEDAIDYGLLSDIPLQNSPSSIAPTVGITNWRVLWGLMATNGPHKLTKTQYQSLRNLIEAIQGSEPSSWRTIEPNLPFRANLDRKGNFLPHFTTLAKHFRPFLLNSLAPKTKIVRANIDWSKRGARRQPGSNTSEVQIPVILPSEYARNDMATGPVWSLMRTTSLFEQSRFRGDALDAEIAEYCIDKWPVVAGRNWFYGPQRTLHLDDEDNLGFTSEFAEPGDIVKVVLLDSSSTLSEEFQRCFGTRRYLGQFSSIVGTIMHSWPVHHTKRRSDSPFSDEHGGPLSVRDQEIRDLFGFVSYGSPSDIVNVSIPEISPEFNDASLDMNSNDAGFKKKNSSREMTEAMKARRDALKKRKEQTERAWRNWRKPVVKPGDTVVMLRPCATHELSMSLRCPELGTTMLTEADRASRLFIVNRFWAENGERSRHVFWIAGAVDLNETANHSTRDVMDLNLYCSSLTPTNSNPLYMDVFHILPLSLRSGERGYSKHTPVSSIGRLDNGELYFVYRFLLYWDGFEVYSGKNASGEGVYLVPLNLPVHARSSPNSVRILCLTPPGVQGDKIMHQILQDVLHGATTGFLDFDAEGQQRRIFLDLVGCIGDTPALNSYLDVMGHTASACCHLCRFFRGSTTLVGSRYATKGNGMISYMRRGFFEHCAVRDCGAKEETCRLLGMKPTESASADAFLRFSSSLFYARDSIRRTNTGVPVVPHYFDVYRAFLVAPDHLLTGHLRNCISLAFQLLPSKLHRETCEMFMIGFLQDVGLQAQTRLVDHSKKTLLSMSMSELYALSVVAHDAFIEGCAYVENISPIPNPTEQKCREAVEIVRSCSELISTMFYLPFSSIDGTLAVKEQMKHGGKDYVRKLQKLTDLHLERVSRICAMKDSDVMALDFSATTPQKRAEILKLRHETQFAIKMLDKPNVHRLRELVSTTLPMVGHISNIGELVLEKTHQILKRTIKNCNNKDIQNHCVRATAFNDWKGRMSIVASDALAGSPSALRGLFRFLAGREALTAANGNPSQSQCKIAVQALGPGGFLARVMSSQGCSVLSSPAPSHESSLTWRIIGGIEVGEDNVPPSVPYGDIIEVGEDNVPPSVPYGDIWNSLRAAFHHDFSKFSILLSDNVTYTNRNGVPGRSFSRGDIIQVLCYKPAVHAFHFPFLVQVNHMGVVKAWEEDNGSSIWCILTFLALTPVTGSSELYAAVVPCVSTAEERNTRYCKFRLSPRRRVAFLKMDETIRKCGVLHRCSEYGCVPIPETRSISHVHNSSPILGSAFFALTIEQGYLPRQG